MKSVDSSQVLNQEEQDHMELLENILSIPSWSEVGVKNWECAPDSSKLSKSEISSLLTGGGATGGGGEAKAIKEQTDSQIGDMMDDTYLFAQLQQQRSSLVASAAAAAAATTTTTGAAPEHLMGRLPEDTATTNSATAAPPSGWRQQPFIGLGQAATSDVFLRESSSNGSHLYGRNNAYRTSEALPGLVPSSGAMFNVYTAPQPRPAMQPAAQHQQGNAGYRASSQAQPVNPTAGGAPRPRVRARRGQATDPHSIAERLRRERIAERMKALQDLVPNANKTDKASMLDEIVDYVKFLQLQVKVLSMSRLGGAGAVPSLVADLPAEGANSLLANTLSRSTGISHDGLASAERQVARLMDEDMGSAMQFLQGKGLCLMPISLATASGKVPLTNLQQPLGDNNTKFCESSPVVATDRNTGTATNNGNGNGNGKLGLKEMTTTATSTTSALKKDGAVLADTRSSPSSKSPKTSDEQRRIQ